MPRLSKSLLALPFVLPFALFGCGDDDLDPAYLGPVDAGATQDVPTPDIEPPTPSSLVSVSCSDSTPVLGPDVTRVVRSIATLDSRAIVAQSAALRAIQLDSQGCPGAPIPSFGTNGSLEIEAVSAVPLPGSRTLVAKNDATVLLDSTGQEVGSCRTNGANLIARSLQADGEGRVAAAFAKTPIALLTVELASPACDAASVPLSPEPFALAAVALARGGGFVTVEQTTPASPLVVARYGSEGVREASSTPYANHGPSKLCSATGLIDTPAGIFVTDTACRRVVLFDGDLLYAVAQLSFQNSPRSAALSPDGKHVLIALAQTLENGAVATFERVRLP
jgi:hypothetical protein